MAQEKPSDNFKVDFDNVDVLNVDFYASIQDTLRWMGEEFSTMAQALWGKQAANFLDGGPGNDQMGVSWVPVRILGKGGFGLVGLWEKTNFAGEVVDEVAIKEMQYRFNENYRLSRNPSLAREAVIMHQLNDAEQRRGYSISNILRLRSFKCFPPSQRWRFYLEFAPYGDASRLIYLYKAWNAYLPEEFLWHVFHSLAKAATIMEQGPFTHLETQKSIDWSVVHLDIKPDNVYLGKSDPAEPFPNYPTIKVGDFGLADLTGVDDVDNPRRYRNSGTEDFMPPEQTYFTVHWHRRPEGFQHDVSRHSPEACKNSEKDMHDPGYKFLSGHNVWAFGKFMHDMLTLSYPQVLDRRMKALITEAEYYGRYGENGIPPITTGKIPEYSPLLRDLIRECLHIEIGKRPTPRQLEERTLQGLQAAVGSRREAAGEAKGPRVYYMGHEINHMPAGNAGIPMRRGEFRSLRELEWPDPTWQPLLSARWAPQVKNGDLVNQPIEEGGPKRVPPALFATVERDLQPLTGNNRGVHWRLHSLATRANGQPGSGGEGDDDNDDDLEDEKQYQKELYQKIRNSGTHDTEEHTPSAHKGTSTDRRQSLEELREARRTALEHLVEEAARIPHPPNVAPGPVRTTPNSPKKPSSQQRPPRRRGRRVLGLSIDGSFQEAEGRVVKGHNLRNRRPSAR